MAARRLGMVIILNSGTGGNTHDQLCHSPWLGRATIEHGRHSNYNTSQPMSFMYFCQLIVDAQLSRTLNSTCQLEHTDILSQ